MPGSTDNLELYLPDAGQSGIAAQLNQNWTTLDGRFDEASGHTHDGTEGEGPPIAVTSIAAIGVPDATKFLRGDGQWAAGAGGGAGITDHGELTGLTDDDHPQYANQARGDARYAQKANNLSDLTNAGTARTNLGAAAASHTHSGTDITSGTVPPARLGSGTASTSTFLRGDQTWATPAGGSGSTTLDDLTDVLITTPSDNQVLTYDSTSSSWRNEAPAGGLTTEQVQDIVGAEIVGGTGITATYDDTAGTVTIASAGGSGLPASPTSGTYLAVNTSNTPIWAIAGGTTAARPTSTARALYHRYYDTTLNKPITWDGATWRDAAGADVGSSSTPGVITSGLIFGLSISEGSGQFVTALSPTSYSGVLGSTTAAEGNDPDWVAQGLDFVPGTSDVVTAASVPDSGWLGAMTVMVVAKLDAGGALCFLQKQAGDGSVNAPLFFGTQGTSPVKLLTNRANTNWRGHTTSAGTMTVGSYACYTVTLPPAIESVPTFYTATTPTTGIVYASSGTGMPTGTGANVQIGRGMLGSNYQMDGVIGYVLVYNRVLTAGEIATNYTALQAIMAARGVTLP